MSFRWYLVLLGLGVGAAALQQNVRITGWEHLRFERRFDGSFSGPRAASLLDADPTAPRLPQAVDTAAPSTGIPNAPTANPVKIATWYVEPLARAGMQSSEMRQRRVELIHQFEALVLTGLHSVDESRLQALIGELNARGALYDFLLSPPTGPFGRGEQMALVYDSTRVRPVGRQHYMVVDHDQMFSFDPWVVWMESVASPQERPWTFTVVVVRLDRERLAEELAPLPHLLQTVRGDGRQEDDVLLVGHFGAPAPTLDALFRNAGYQCAVHELPTDVTGQRADDHILLPMSQTAPEWTGRSGVLDFMRAFNLSSSQASEISPNLPVWAEFRGQEG